MPEIERPSDVLTFLLQRDQFTRKQEALLDAFESKSEASTVEEAIEIIRHLVPLKRTVEYVKSGHRVAPLPWQVAMIGNCTTVLTADWDKCPSPARRKMITELASVIRRIDTMRKMSIEDAILDVAGGARAILEDNDDEWRHGDDFGERSARRKAAAEYLLEHLDHPMNHAEPFRPANEETGQRAAIVISEGRLQETVGRLLDDDLEAAPLSLATTRLPERTNGTEELTPSVALTIALETVIENLDRYDVPIDGPAIAYCAWILERRRVEFDRAYLAPPTAQG